MTVCEKSWTTAPPTEESSWMGSHPNRLPKYSKRTFLKSNEQSTDVQPGLGYPCGKGRAHFTEPRGTVLISHPEKMHIIQESLHLTRPEGLKYVPIPSGEGEPWTKPRAEKVHLSGVVSTEMPFPKFPYKQPVLTSSGSRALFARSDEFSVETSMQRKTRSSPMEHPARYRPFTSDPLYCTDYITHRSVPLVKWKRLKPILPKRRDGDAGKGAGPMPSQDSLCDMKLLVCYRQLERDVAEEKNLVSLLGARGQVGYCPDSDDEEDDAPERSKLASAGGVNADDSRSTLSSAGANGEEDLGQTKKAAKGGKTDKKKSSKKKK
eukprot:Rmarinus@m.10095